MKTSDLDVLSYSMVDVFENDDHSQSELYHEFSKLNRETIVDVSQRVSSIMRDPGLIRMMARGWKTYSGNKRIPLPQPELGSMTVEDCFRRRRSVSSYSDRFGDGPISLEQLSSVLGFSYGATRTLESERFPGEKHILRASTSAGGLYPLEIYPIVFNVQGLSQGIYHYRMVDHCLEVLQEGPIKEETLNCSTYKDLSSNAAVFFVITGMFKRCLTKYQNRGYRFMLNDVGALLQSLYLTSTALDLGACALGGFYDDEVGELLGTNLVDEPPLICFLLGQKPAKEGVPLTATKRS